MKRGGGDGPDPSDLTYWIRLCVHKFCFGDTMLADICKISSRSVVINLKIKWRKANFYVIKSCNFYVIKSCNLRRTKSCASFVLTSKSK